VSVRSTVETVAIIGAGIGGLYLVAELGIAGFTSTILRTRSSPKIHTCGGVDVEGDRGGFAAVQHAASDIGPSCYGRGVQLTESQPWRRGATCRSTSKVRSGIRSSRRLTRLVRPQASAPRLP
jgi:hypothetical protein